MLKLAFSNAVVISVFEEFKYPRESVKAIDNMRAQRLVNMIFGTTLGILPTIGLILFQEEDAMLELTASTHQG